MQIDSDRRMKKESGRERERERVGREWELKRLGERVWRERERERERVCGRESWIGSVGVLCPLVPLK